MIYSIVTGFMMNTNRNMNNDTSPVDRVCFFWDGSDDERYVTQFINAILKDLYSNG